MPQIRKDRFVWQAGEFEIEPAWPRDNERRAREIRAEREANGTWTEEEEYEFLVLFGKDGELDL